MMIDEKQIRLFWDNQGLLVHHDGDGGDTLADTGTYIVGKWLSVASDFDRPIVIREAMDMWLRLGFPNNPVRHPVQWSDPKHVSYDQMNSNIIAMGLMGLRNPIRTILVKMIRNWFRFPNGDPASFGRLSVFFRALGYWWMYPWFLMTDAWMLFVQLPWLRLKRVRPGRFRTWLYKKTKWKWLVRDHGGNYGRMNVGDCRNYRLALIQASTAYETWFSAVAILLYEWMFRDAWQLFFQKDNRLDLLFDNSYEEA